MPLPPTLPDPGEGTPAKLRLGTTRFESVNAPAADTPPPVDVHAVLRDNLAREKSAGLHELAPLPPRRSRRRRDYWRLLLAGNLLLGSVAFIGSSSPILFVCGIGGMGAFTAGLTWIMWFVMDNY